MPGFPGRSRGAGNVDVKADSILTSKAESKASAKGGDSSGGGDSDAETYQQDQPRTDQGRRLEGADADRARAAVGPTGKLELDTEAGKDNRLRSGTAVAATVAVNYLDGDADARISDGVTISASGAVKVETTHQTTAHAIATATSTNTSSSTGVAAAVGAQHRGDRRGSAAIGSNASVTGIERFGAVD